MRFLPETRLTSLTEPDRLTFRVEREHGWLEWAIAAAITLLLLGIAYHTHSLILLLFGVLGAVSVAIALAGSRPTELIVTTDELLLRRDIGGKFSSEFSIKTTEIKAMQYQAGGEDSLAGLYLKRRWAWTCLLAGLTEEQTGQVLDEISRRFPHIGAAPTPHL